MSQEDDYAPINLDWSSVEARDAFATVTKVEPGTSKKFDETIGRGARYLKLSLSLEPTGYANDVVMLEGKGGPMGLGKLRALGVERGQPVIPADIKGRRVYAKFVVEDEQLKVKRYLPFPENAPPREPPPPPARERPTDDSVPF